ncbi:MAG: S8 family serine peptidase [Actinomycetota bacterium]
MFLCALLFIAACSLSVQASPEEPAQSEAGPRRLAGAEVGELAPARAPQVLVGLRTSLSAQAMADITSALGLFESVADEITSAAGTMAYVLDLKPEASMEQALAALRSLPNIAYAEPNYMRKADDTPTEPDFSRQWGFKNTGQEIDGGYGTVDADIDATEAWDLERGNTNPVTVAIIDTGIDDTHPDLDGQVWKNTDEVPANQVDDDGNGYVDDATGYNWAGISQPYTNDPAYVWFLGSATNCQRLAQSIVGTGQYLTHVGVGLAKVGSPTQSITVSVRTSLDGSDLASFNFTPGEITTPAYYYKALSSAVKLNDGTTYYLVFRTSQLNSSNYYYLYNSYPAGDFYAAGSEYQWTGSTWVNYPGDDLVFITNPNGMPRDDNGHGTHCAGIVAAEKNGVGVIGASRGATIMPLKAADCAGSLYDSDIIAAIYYAADNGADIISMSFGGTGYSTATQNAVDYAYGKGVALFAAAGNSGDSTMQYPAGYNNVIGVGATDFNDAIADFSTFNSSVDVSAPGVDIYSTLPTYDVMFNSYYGDPKDYAYCSGTSMATPMAAGLGALVLSRNPKYTRAQVQQAIQAGADDKGSAGWDSYFGHGRINAYNTLNSVPPLPKINSLSPTAAVIGTVITISGKSFGAIKGASSVSFGATQATNYTLWSDTVIKCKVPAGVANIVNVSVTTALGKSNMVPFSVKPRISRLAPLSGTPGTVVTIKGTGFGPSRGTSYVKFGGTRVTSYVSWSATEIKVKVPPMAAATVLVKVTTKGGLSNGMSFTVK